VFRLNFEGLKKDGYDHVDLDKLIAFAFTAFRRTLIGKVQTLGYKHPEPDQL